MIVNVYMGPEERRRRFGPLLRVHPWLGGGGVVEFPGNAVEQRDPISVPPMRVVGVDRERRTVTLSGLP
jgi:hypothetical protein